MFSYAYNEMYIKSTVNQITVKQRRIEWLLSNYGKHNHLCKSIDSYKKDDKATTGFVNACLSFTIIAYRLELRYFGPSYFDNSLVYLKFSK